MSIITPLIAFSHAHCVSICAFLVPFALLMTFGSLYHMGIGHQLRLYATVSLASLAAGLMLLHVWSWWIVGVVMGPTYILSVVAIVCLVINHWAVGHQHSLMQVISSCIALAGSLKEKLWEIAAAI